MEDELQEQFERPTTPRREVVRHVVTAAVGFIPIAVALIYELGLDGVPFFATCLTIAGALSRVLALDNTEKWLNRHVPWLSAEPYHGRRRKEDREQ